MGLWPSVQIEAAIGSTRTTRTQAPRRGGRVRGQGADALDLYCSMRTTGQAGL